MKAAWNSNIYICVCLCMYIYTMAFQLIWGILHKIMARRSAVYCWTFFKEICTDGSFHAQEDCQCELLYWSLHPELIFTGVSVCFHSMDSFILTKTCSSVHITLILHRWNFLSARNLMTEPLSKPGSLFDLESFQLAWKEILLWD